MASGSTSVIAALDRLAGKVGSVSSDCRLSHPEYATSPYEEVLVFNSPVTIKLVTVNGKQYFTSDGKILDLRGNEGGSVNTSLQTSVTPATAAFLLTFPPVQQPVSNSLDVDTGSGSLPAGQIPPGSYTKQFYDFGDGNTLAMEGPAFPKLTFLEGGSSAQFWVGFVGAISQGTGKYEGAKGMGGFDGSAYFKNFPPPSKFDAIVAVLSQGFPASVGAYIKIVDGGHIAK